MKERSMKEKNYQQIISHISCKYPVEKKTDLTMACFLRAQRFTFFFVREIFYPKNKLKNRRGGFKIISRV